MSITLPSYYRATQYNYLEADRRTTEQDEYNRTVDNTLTTIILAIGGTLGLAVVSQFQTRDFLIEKTTNPIENFTLRHDFGRVATNYEILNAQANGGGAVTVDYPGRPTVSTDIPLAGVDDQTFITLSLAGRADYLIRVKVDLRILLEEIRVPV